jgi:hypothetical protein
MSNVDHVKGYEQSIKNCLVDSRSLSLSFPLTSTLFARARPLFALSARVASVVVPSTLNSRTSSTANNMAPAVVNGPIEPSGMSIKGSQSSKMHSKVASSPLRVFSPSSSYLGINSGASTGATGFETIIDASFRVYAPSLATYTFANY